MSETAVKPKKRFSLQEQVEWIAIAFVLALTVRAFVVEAYKIPTGSMAPTLYGDHLEVKCPECGATFVVRGSESGSPGGFLCPVCGARDTGRPVKAGGKGGDRILVSKSIYVFSEPRRWDVFVFKNPQRGSENTNFVKRLVGLPGERVEIRDGQIFINGRIAVKPPRIQRTLWQDVYDAAVERDKAAHWDVREPWTARPEGLFLASPSADWRTVEYDGNILDFYPYNGQDGDNVVSDLSVSGHVRIERGQGEFAAAVSANDETTRAVFAASGSTLSVELRVNEETLSSRAVPLGRPGEFDFEIVSVDGVREVRVDGKPVLKDIRDVTPDDVPVFTESNGVSLQGRAAPVLVSGIKIRRDIYYRANLRLPDSVARQSYVAEIPADQFLGLGDNSPKSSDSREWGFVPRGNILGKAFLLFWPPRRVGPVF